MVPSLTQSGFSPVHGVCLGLTSNVGLRGMTRGWRSLSSQAGCGKQKHLESWQSKHPYFETPIFPSQNFLNQISCVLLISEPIIRFSSNC